MAETFTLNIGLAKKFIRIPPVMEKPERTFWPTQHHLQLKTKERVVGRCLGIQRQEGNSHGGGKANIW